MKASLYMDIAVTHVRVRLLPDMPGWLTRTFATLSKRKAGTDALAAQATGNDQPLPLPSNSREETVAVSIEDNHKELVAAILAAAAQALETLATDIGALNGCRLQVRIGMSLTTLSLVPLAFPAGAAPSDRQLQLIADSVTREARGSRTSEPTVRWTVQPDNENLCVMALDTSLLAGLQTLCEGQNLRLISCQPAIAEGLDRELLASARSRDNRTLVWSEADPSGQRLSAVNYLRVSKGSLVNAWRTVVPPADKNARIEQELEASTNRFLIASAADTGEQAILSTWPSLIRAAQNPTGYQA